ILPDLSNSSHDVLALVSRRLALTTQEAPVNLLARYYDLLIQRPGPAVASGRIQYDFRTLITESLSDVMALRIFAIVPYLRPEHVPSGDGQPAVSVESVPYFEISHALASITDPSFMQSVRANEGRNRADWREKLDGSTDQLTGRDRIEVNKRP